MRGDDLDAAGDFKTWRVGVDDEARQPLGARSLAGAREHDVMVGDAAVGNPGFQTVEPHMRRSVLRRGGGERADVGAGFRLGEREGRDMTAGANRRQIFGFCRIAAEQRYRGGPQPLHGEGKIGQAVVPG